MTDDPKIPDSMVDSNYSDYLTRAERIEAMLADMNRQSAAILETLDRLRQLSRDRIALLDAAKVDKPGAES